MNVKPGDLFFGLMEFLAFIVPGFILCVTLPPYLFCQIPGFLDITNEKATTFAWVTFIMVSYILGHFLHHVCALTLNPLYEVTYMKLKLRKHQTFIESAENEIKSKLPFHSDYLKIAEAYLRVNNPALISDLEKHEANSKLFRSLCMLSLYLCFYPHIHWTLRAILIIVSFLSFTKFANQRWRHRFLVYEYFTIATRK